MPALRRVVYVSDRQRQPQQNDHVADQTLSIEGTVIAVDVPRHRVCIRWDLGWTEPPGIWQDMSSVVVLSSPAV